LWARPVEVACFGAVPDDDAPIELTLQHGVNRAGITLEYARLEQFISHFIWALVAKDARIGQTITAPMTFRGRITLLRSLFHMLPARERSTRSARRREPIFTPPVVDCSDLSVGLGGGGDR